MFGFGYYRCGTWYSRDEYRHLCFFDITKNRFEEKVYDMFNIDYYPLKFDDDKILFVENKQILVYKLKIN